MRTWTRSESREISDSYSLSLTVGPGNSEQVELGMALISGRLYVRAFRGRGSQWYQAAIKAGLGTVAIGTVRVNVELTPTDGPSEEIEAAYLAKYGPRAALVASPEARAATLLIEPT